MTHPAIHRAEMVLAAKPFDQTLAYFQRLGFTLLKIFPADAPRVAVITGFGLCLRLDADSDAPPGRLLLHMQGGEGIPPQGYASPDCAPNGTIIEWLPQPDLELPPLKPEFILSRHRPGEDWAEGRAGMRYRDLIPGRLGGRFIASHIHVESAGRVPDYVHYHRIRFQLIYCWRGWVRVVYQDQGEPFVLKPGDCVLQPPGIRHRVLECSAGLDVIEISCPAEHETLADPGLELPNAGHHTGQEYGGQRFVWHRADRQAWTGWRYPGFETKPTAIARATGGLASVSRVRATESQGTGEIPAADELNFLVVLAGDVRVQYPSEGDSDLHPGDAVVIPPGETYSLRAENAGAEFLEILFPAGPT